MNETLLLEVRQIAADLLKRGVDDVPADATRDTLPGWDSLVHVNIVLAVEQQFDVQFKPEEILEMLSIELIAMLIEEKQAGKGSS